MFWYLETSVFFKTPFPGRISIPTSFVSLFIFYILSYLLSKTLCCLSGCLVSSVRVQKLFCGICLAFKCSFDEFVGEKVVSLSYSSTILGPPPTVSSICRLLLQLLLCQFFCIRTKFFITINIFFSQKRLLPIFESSPESQRIKIFDHFCH